MAMGFALLNPSYRGTALSIRYRASGNPGRGQQTRDKR
jgi:hypothetical protein